MRTLGRWAFLAALVFAILSGAAHAQGTTPQTHDEFLQAGNEAYGKGSIDKAVEYFGEMLKLDAESAVGYLMRGTALSTKKDYAAAIRDFDKALALNKYEWLALKRRAEAQEKLGRKDLAAADVAASQRVRAELATPRTAEEWYDRAVYLEKRSEWLDAIDAYSATIKLNPDFRKDWMSIYERRGDLLDLTFAPDKAILDFTKALEQNPNRVELLLKRGRSLLFMGLLDEKNYDEAAKDFAAVIARAPDLKRMPEWLVEAYTSRGSIFFDKENYAAALADFDAALAIDSKHLRAIEMRGATNVGLKKTDEAIADFTRYLALSTNPVNVLAERARLYADKKDFDKAFADYSAALALAPKNAALWVERGLVLFDKGDMPGALADFEQAVVFDPKSAMARTNRGSAHGRMGNWEKAIADYTAAIALDPKDTVAFRNRAIAYRKTGKPDLAAADEAQLKALGK